MHVLQCLDGFQLDQKHALDQQVGEVLDYHHVFVEQLVTELLNNREAQRTKSSRQRILIHLFQEPGTSVLSTVNVELITLPDRSFSSVLSA
jgi:hypothetical protein